MVLTTESARKHYYAHTSRSERRKRESSNGTLTLSPQKYIQHYPKLRLKGVDNTLPDGVTIECDRFEPDQVRKYLVGSKMKGISFSDHLFERGFEGEEIDGATCDLYHNGKFCGSSVWTMDWENRKIHGLDISVKKKCRKNHFASYLMRDVVNYSDDILFDIDKIQSVPQDADSPPKNKLIEFYSSFSDPKRVSIVDGFVNRKFNS